LFLDAEGRLRAEAGKTRYRMTALERERTLSIAESNINQWKALIDPSVDLMVAYGTSGLKSSDIQAFLNSLTLLWIGVGVNK
jgi:outer membrane protein TolC